MIVFHFFIRLSRILFILYGLLICIAGESLRWTTQGSCEATTLVFSINVNPRGQCVISSDPSSTKDPSGLSQISDALTSAYSTSRATCPPTQVSLSSSTSATHLWDARVPSLIGNDMCALPAAEPTTTAPTSHPRDNHASTQNVPIVHDDQLVEDVDEEDILKVQEMIKGDSLQPSAENVIIGDLDGSNVRTSVSLAISSHPSSSTVSLSTVTTTYSPQATTLVSDEIIRGVVDDRKTNRFNYASFDCGARVLSHNKEASGASFVLLSSKDQYMLNTCKSDKFLVIELCQEILVNSVRMANFEFFSSMFKTFKLFASANYPPADIGWILLGTFMAENSRSMQEFKVSKPKIWSKYLKIEFLDQYGREHYCPLSHVGIYGTTMVEDLALMRNHDENDVAADQDDMTPLVSPRWNPYDRGNLISQIHTSPAKSLPALAPQLQDISFPKPNFRKSNPDQLADRLFRFVDRPEILDYLRPLSGEYVESTPVISADSGPQDSVFKSIVKRLKALESNYTKSFRYMQEQTRVFLDILHSIDQEHSDGLELLYEEVDKTLTQLYLELRKFDEGWREVFTNHQQDKSLFESRLNVLVERVNQLSQHTFIILTWQAICTAIFIVPILTNHLFRVLARKAERRSLSRAFSDYETPTGSPKRDAFDASINRFGKKRKRRKTPSSPRVRRNDFMRRERYSD